MSLSGSSIRDHLKMSIFSKLATFFSIRREGVNDINATFDKDVRHATLNLSRQMYLLVMKIKTNITYDWNNSSSDDITLVFTVK